MHTERRQSPITGSVIHSWSFISTIYSQVKKTFWIHQAIKLGCFKTLKKQNKQTNKQANTQLLSQHKQDSKNNNNPSCNLSFKTIHAMVITIASHNDILQDLLQECNHQGSYTSPPPPNFMFFPTSFSYMGWGVGRGRGRRFFFFIFMSRKGLWKTRLFSVSHFKMSLHPNSQTTCW